MNRVVFTTYDDIDHVVDRWGTNAHQIDQIKEYKDRLLDNKKLYADKIGADFKFYNNTMKD